MGRFVQAARLPGDGTVSLRRDGDHLEVSVTTDGVVSSVRMSEYNASRIFAFLAIFLEIPLPAQLGKAIKLG